jgi:hypothetical protein
MLVSLYQYFAKPLREIDKYDAPEETEEHFESGKFFPEEMNLSGRGE